MYYLFLEVYDPAYREDIYLALQSIGIQRAINLDAQNLAAALSDERTFFTGFFKADKIESGSVLLILAQVSSKDKISEFLSNLKEGGVDIDSRNIINLTLIPAALSFSSEHGLQDEENS